MDDNAVLYNFRRVMPSGAIVEAFARTADSTTYLGGVKYRLHYGFLGDDHPIVRYDNRHGYHERHAGDTTTEFDDPGPDELRNRFRTAVRRYEREYTH
ncbi:DUF6516 family protein [Haladaptatus sp. YSMS36]|uniref:toxin-antitoxin system TumE family protein n=1 Tax=Haladaptatus sp. YSMS36 TaxID=3033384 RepID=UPI0023E7B8B4|nr:DUF6516 family protein [Haladaptatus sp. YSMS36]